MHFSFATLQNSLKTGRIGIAASSSVCAGHYNNGCSHRGSPKLRLRRRILVDSKMVLPVQLAPRPFGWLSDPVPVHFLAILVETKEVYNVSRDSKQTGDTLQVHMRIDQKPLVKDFVKDDH